MGNQSSSSSSSTHAGNTRRSRSPTDAPPPTTVVDGGFLEPQSMIYASSVQEYSRPTVHKLILERRLAPFYLGLNDFEPDWAPEEVVAALDEGDLQATRNLREALQTATDAAAEAEVAVGANPVSTRKGKEAATVAAAAVLHRERLAEMIRLKEKRGGGLQWSSKQDQARLYVGRAIECPICFLYYPPGLVHTRCCDQPICTECFVQIKRADPTTTHLESEPAACPFCMELNFGCLYIREKAEVPKTEMSKSQSAASGLSLEEPPSGPIPKPRRKSFAHTEKHVVTTDQIHPDWEAKVEAVRATVARRANRRIVFRQVGDRLIPVGITSGREGDGANATITTTQLPPGFASQVAAALEAGGSGSSNREGRRATRRRNQEMAQYLESMGVGVGQDLEEMMVVEAMRLSMLEDEERQKKDQADKDKQVANGSAEGGAPPSPVVDLTAPGTSRAGSFNLSAPHTPTTTANLLSDAIAAPMGSTSLLDGGSPFLGSTGLPNIPSLQPIITPLPRPSASSRSPSPARTPTSHRAASGSISSLGSLAVGGVVAAVAAPSSGSSFPRPGEATDLPSITRGILNAGLTATVPSRRPSVSTSAPPQLPDFQLSSPLDASLPIFAVSESPVAGPSTSVAPTPSSLSVGTASSASVLTASSASASDDWDDDEPPLNPSQGYEQLEDDDEHQGGPPVSKAREVQKGSDLRHEVAATAGRSSRSLVDVS